MSAHSQPKEKTNKKELNLELEISEKKWTEARHFAQGQIAARKYRMQTLGHLFRDCLRWQPQQEILWT